MPVFTAPVDDLLEFNKCHTPGGRADGGQFCSTKGGEKLRSDNPDAVKPGSGVMAWGSTDQQRDFQRDQQGADKRPTPIKVKDLDEAVGLILQGKVVELTNVKAVNTVLTKLAAMAQDAAKRGEKAPHYDLCNVSVAGTNLFCGSKVRSERFPNGIPRIKMPQFIGVPEPGSEAAKLTPSDKGTVDVAPAFIDHLADLGIRTARVTIKAGALKASQAELLGPKVAEMMQAVPTEKLLRKIIFISRDDYVIDGHHRWASIVGKDSEDGTLDLDMQAIKVDAPISEVLILARKFTKRIGVRPSSGAG